MKLPVLLVTSRADHGGGPAHLLNLIQAAADELAWHIACPRDAPYWDRFRAAVGAERMLEIPHRRFSAAAVRHIAVFARKHRIRLLHSHGKGAGALGRLAALVAAIPCVHTFHGVHMEGLGTFERSLYAAYERAAGAVTAAIIAVSDGEFQMIRNLGISEGKIRVIANGLDIGPEPSPAPADGPFKVAVVSRFDPAKNSGALVGVASAWEAINPRRAWRFEVFGDGPERSHVARAIAEAGLEHRFALHGLVPDARARLSGCHCLLSTSIREGLPLNLIEAALTGRPVVASDVVGNREVAQAIGGTVYPLDRLAAAAQALETLAAHPTQREETGLLARQLASSVYDRREMAARTISVYHDALNWH